MGIVLSIGYFIIFLISGAAVSLLLLPKERAIVRLWLGGVFALLMLMVFPALFALLLDFTLAAQIFSLILAAAVGIGCGVFALRRGGVIKGSFKDELPLLFLLPIFIFGAYLFLTHTIPEKDGALFVGQSTYGDLALHLGLVTSLARQGTFPPEYSILPGTPIGYPFLCDSISATFYVLGAPLRFSMLLPALFAYALVLLGAYLFFERWLVSRKAAVFATLLFFIGGGFGFAYFVDTIKANPENFTSIFTGYYTTPTNYVDYGIKWVNPIADMLIPQRATLLGWALLFPALYLLRRAAFENETRLFPILGVLAGCMPLVHTHSFFALGVISAVYLVFALFDRSSSRKTVMGLLIYGATAVLISAPQLIFFTFRQASGFLNFHFNWANETDSFLWFYIKNMGLIFLLLPFSFMNLEKKEKIFYLGALVLWLLSEVIVFQPNRYDNNKLLFVWFFYTCGITARFLILAYEKLNEIKGRRLMAGMVCCALFLSGILTLGREAVSEYELISKDEVEAAKFIDENTEPDSLFLTNNNHNNMVAALTGRNILCGTGSYLYYHGVNYQEREDHLRQMYESPESCFEEYSKLYGIDYVLFSPHERYGLDSDEEYFRSRYSVVFANSNVCIYKVEK